jgi:hypothetical protein
LRKTFALPDGAALLVNHKDWTGMPMPLPCRESRLPLGFIVKSMLRQIQNNTGIKVRNLSEQLTRHLRRLRTGNAMPISLPESEFEIPGGPAIHCESIRMLAKIDATNEVLRRRNLYQQFHQELRSLDIEPVFGELPKGVAPYGYPFRADTNVAATVAGIARRSGFDCFSWPDLPDTVTPIAPVYYQNVWWVNFLC